MRPLILVAPHRRELDTVLGRLRTNLIYDAYMEKIDRAGGEPLTAWPGSHHVEELVARADAVLLVGGGDVDPDRFGSTEIAEGIDRQRDHFEVGLVRCCQGSATPLLAICRGAQVMNVALGGRLERVEGHRQEADLAQPGHAVTILPESRLHDVVQEVDLKVNSFHRWAPLDLGRGLTAVAHAPDGVIEAYETDGEWWAVGVQWHAELLDDLPSQTLFDGLVQVSGQAR